MGAEMLKEYQWFGVLQGVGGNIEHVYNNGVSNQVIFRIPTATQVGGLKDNDNGHLTTENALDQLSLFLNDTWSFKRFTVNGGVRWDRYNGWLPEQNQLAATVGPVSVQAKTFPEQDLFTWNVVAPRIGVVYDLRGDGKTVLKGNYGLYFHNPGVGVPSDVNPNTGTKSATYLWNDANGDRRYQPGEETTQQSATLEGATALDPNIKAPYSHEAAAWFEQQLTDTLGIRAGFVYKTEDDLLSLYIPTRGLEVFEQVGVPFTFVDIGVDGVRGTADDRTLPMVGLPSANAATLFPTTQVEMNLPQYSRYKTFETSINKRYGNRWSASLGGALYVDERFPERLSAEPESTGRRGSHRVELQGQRLLRRGVRHSHLAGAAPSVGRELRAHRDADVPGRRDRHRHGHLSRTVEFQPRRQHHGVRRARREDGERHRSRALPAVPRHLQHHQQPRVGNDQPGHGHGLSEAIGDPGAHYRQARVPVPLVGSLA